MKYRRCIFFFLTFLQGGVLADNPFVIQGVKGELKDNVSAYLSDIKQLKGTSDREVKSRVLQAMKALGYYQPGVRVERQSPKKALVTIVPGKRIIIADSRIELSGAAANDGAFTRVITEAKLKPGDPLHHGHYEHLKSQFSSLALNRGYFDARLSESELFVQPETQSAYIHLQFESGERYRFGKTHISGSHINPKKVESMIPYEAGDPYETKDVGLLNQRLANIGWFDSAYAGAVLDRKKAGSVPVRVLVKPAVKNRMETGIGYTTNNGPRLRLKWRKPWINSAGHSFNLQSEISQYEPTVQFAYRIPLEKVLEDYYQLTGGVRYVDIHDTVSTDLNLGIERHWTVGNQWDQALYFRWLFEDYTQGAFESGVSNMGLVGMSYAHTFFTEGVVPKHGQKSWVSFGYSDTYLGAAASMFVLEGRQGWVRTLADNHRTVVKLSAGAVFTESVEDVPPAMRYFIGGDNSLRGYRYQSISPEDVAGMQVGGRYEAIAVAEYQYRVYGNFWGAVFFDYGSSWNESPDFRRGTGVGLRWASPVGSIRLDVGFGLDNPDSSYEIHFSLGPEL